jgi:hypothetical protein
MLIIPLCGGGLWVIAQKRAKSMKIDKLPIITCSRHLDFALKISSERNEVSIRTLISSI